MANDYKDYNLDYVPRWYEKVPTYKNLLPRMTFKYWNDKLGQISPNFIDKDGNIIEDNEKISKAKKRFQKVLDFIDLKELKARLLDKLIGPTNDGKTGYIIEVVNTEDGLMPWVNVPTGEVFWSKVQGQWKVLSFIENTAQGTFPIIRFTQFGNVKDVYDYSIDNSSFHSLTIEQYEIAQSIVNKQKKEKSELKHNFGFVRAGIIKNRNGQQDLNTGLPEFNEDIMRVISLIDEIESKIWIETKTQTTNINISKGAGFRAGNTGKELADMKLSKEGLIETTYKDGYRINTFSAENKDEVLFNVDPLKPFYDELTNLQDKKLNLVFRYLQLPLPSDMLKGTNKTEFEISVNDDNVVDGLKSRKEDFQSALTEIFNKVFLIDKQISPDDYENEIEGVKMTILIEDLRKTLAIIDRIDKFAKILSIEDIYTMAFGKSNNDAKYMLSKLNKSFKENPSQFLAMMNGNLPANASVIKDLSFIDYSQNKPQDNNNQQPESQNKSNSKSKKLGKKPKIVDNKKE